MLAFHGSRDKVDFDFVGYNSRLDELQASFLRIFLTQLDEWNRGRREAAARYAELGLGELVELPQDEAGHIYHLFVCRSPERDRIRAALVRGRHRHRDLLRHAAAPAARAPLPRQRGRLAARDRARRAGELLRAALADDLRRAAGACHRRRPLRSRRAAARRMTGFGRHRLLQLLIDAGIVALSWFLAFELRFDQGLPVYYDTLLRRTILLVVAIKVVVFLLFGFHRRWWRYVSVHDMWSAARGVVVASLVADVTVYLVSPVHNVRLPRSIAVMDLLITLALIAGARLFARTVIERPRSGVVARGTRGDRRRRGRRGAHGRRGDAALADAPLHADRLRRRRPDEEEHAHPRRARARHDRGAAADRARLLAGRGADRDPVRLGRGARAASSRRRRPRSVPVKTLPGLYELITGDVQLAQIRPVQVEDVLGREQVEVDMREVGSYLEGHTVLVTGAGGSIGAELCRQIARMGPTRLILVDNAETPLFEIERELVAERDFTAAIPKLVDVKNRKALRREVFEKYRPTIVFHAAAYKHVPLMETHPLESVRNNVVATKIVAELAAEFEVERFVLISTDKAVNPKTVMGQSKALCEWIVESLGHRRDIPTRFVAVRFGNVLNSSGSVIPTFRKQIEKGGPVTVTHAGDDALLHDDPGGGVARRAGRRDRRPRPGLRARHGRAGADPRSRVQHDPPLRQGAAAARGSRDGAERHRDQVRRLASRREAARGAVGRERGGRRDRSSEDHAAEPRRRSTPTG